MPYAYPVAFTSGLFQAGNLLLHRSLGELSPKARVLVLIDDGLVNHWPRLVGDIKSYWSAHATTELATTPLITTGGERAKSNTQVFEQVIAKIQELGLDRQSVVMAVGGGAFLDVIGYAAAVVHRGVRHVRVPTTVLSQNDSGVGVKNGINAFGAKNFLGTFAPPLAVFNDFKFLSTLDGRDKAAGMAEGVKVALLRDPSFFAWMEGAGAALGAFEDRAVEYLVRRTAELHLQQIARSGDAFESGNARPLDYGHWSAHKLESLSNYEIRHGEAVAIGMALDCRYATLMGLLPEAETERVLTLLQQLHLPTWHPLLEKCSAKGTPEFLDGLEDFRQHLGGSLSVPLLAAVGKEVQASTMDEQKIVAAATWLKTRASQ